MKLFISVYLILYLTFEGGRVLALKKYTIENLIDDVSPFIPGSRFVLTTAYNLLSLYEQINSMRSSNFTVIANKLDELDHKLDGIGNNLYKMDSKVNTLKDNVEKLTDIAIDELTVKAQIHANYYDAVNNFEKHVNDLGHLYREYVKYKNRPIDFRNDPTINYFIDNVLDPGKKMHIALEGIYNQLINSGKNVHLLDILADKHVAYYLTCRQKQSAVYQINKLYKDAMRAQVKGLLMTEFAYALLNKKNNKSHEYEDDLEIAVENIYSRSSQIVSKIKYAMSRASDYYWNCDPNGLEKDNTYSTLGPIFQTYFLKEKDTKDNARDGTCSGTCSDRNSTITKCRSKLCKAHPCSGAVVDCKSTNSVQIDFCFASPKNDRKYYYIQKKTEIRLPSEFYGKQNKCDKPLVAHKSKIDLPFKCEICQCTCLIDNKKVGVDRYFSLRNVTSDIDKNKVVTGVKFAKKNNIFHIQIEQGVLLENGEINPETVDWKPIDNFTVTEKYITNGVDYHKISWTNRTVNLDDLTSPSNTVLTGLKFKLVDGALQLEIRATPFNFSSGELYGNKSTWITSGNSTDRHLVDQEYDIPTSSSYRYIQSSSGQSIKFTTSSMKNDVGQTVVPFIDLEAIKTDYSVPVSGVGLMLVGPSSGLARFLSFKMFTYNYASHLQD